MEVTFDDKKLQKLCENEKQAVKKLGKDSAKKLWARLADLQAAKNVTELVAGDPHSLVGDRAGQMAVRLAGGKRLVFESAHSETPTKPDGGINWSAVTQVLVVFIGDYHDD